METLAACEWVYPIDVTFPTAELHSNQFKWLKSILFPVHWPMPKLISLEHIVIPLNNHICANDKFHPLNTSRAPFICQIGACTSPVLTSILVDNRTATDSALCIAVFCQWTLLLNNIRIKLNSGSPWQSRQVGRGYRSGLHKDWRSIVVCRSMISL
mgnify:CR=1 FL=1